MRGALQGLIGETLSQVKPTAESSGGLTFDADDHTFHGQGAEVCPRSQPPPKQCMLFTAPCRTGHLHTASPPFLSEHPSAPSAVFGHRLGNLAWIRFTCALSDKHVMLMPCKECPLTAHSSKLHEPPVCLLSSGVCAGGLLGEGCVRHRLQIQHVRPWHGRDCLPPPHAVLRSLARPVPSDGLQRRRPLLSLDTRVVSMPGFNLAEFVTFLLLTSGCYSY